jgi:hypothetical protein
MERTFQYYWEAMQPEQKKRLAAMAGTTYQVLHHVARGRRVFSPTRAIKIADGLRELGFSRVMLKHLRPDIWTKE